MNVNFLYTTIIVIIFGFLTSACGYFGYNFYTGSIVINSKEDTKIFENTMNYEPINGKKMANSSILDAYTKNFYINFCNKTVISKNSNKNIICEKPNLNLNISETKMFNLLNKDEFFYDYMHLKENIVLNDFNNATFKAEYLSLYSDENEFYKNVETKVPENYKIAYEDAEIIITMHKNNNKKFFKIIISYLIAAIKKMNSCPHNCYIIHKCIVSIFLDKILYSFRLWEAKNYKGSYKTVDIRWFNSTKLFFYADKNNLKLKRHINLSTNNRKNNILKFTNYPFIKKNQTEEDLISLENYKL